MPLVIKETKRYQHPTEDAWVDLCLPLSAGDMSKLRANGNRLALSFDLAESVVRAWSYDAPVTQENLQLLDIDTWLWLTREITSGSGIIGDSEKKGSASNSPRTTGRAKVNSRQNSVT